MMKLAESTYSPTACHVKVYCMCVVPVLVRQEGEFLCRRQLSSRCQWASQCAPTALRPAACRSDDDSTAGCMSSFRRCSLPAVVCVQSGEANWPLCCLAVLPLRPARPARSLGGAPGTLR